MNGLVYHDTTEACFKSVEHDAISRFHIYCIQQNFEKELSLQHLKKSVSLKNHVHFER